MHRFVLSLSVSLSLLALVACRPTPRLEHLEQREPAVTVIESASLPRGCATLIDTETPDPLRIAKTKPGIVLYANEQVGLALVDVSHADAPSLIAVSAFTGTPLGVFEIDGAALVVYAPWDQPASTVVRAVSFEGRSLGEVTLAGAPRDARRIGDVLVVTRDAAGGAAVSSFVLAKGALSKRDDVFLAGGSAAVTGASPRGVAIAHDALEADRSAVTWLSLTDSTLAVRGTATVAGVVPRARRATDHVMDVTEDDQARIVTCSTSACAPGSAAAYASIDFADADHPRVTSSALIPRAADAPIGFQGTRLIVARPASDRSNGSDLAFFATEHALAPAGAVQVRGTVSSIVVRDSGDVITVGWTGNATIGKRAIVHHVDARGTPRLVGAASFGGDWTWTSAYDDDRTMSFDPFSSTVALPMTTVHGDGAASSAVQIVSFEPRGPRAIAEEPISAGDRLLFVDGHLLAFSAAGVVAVRRDEDRR